MHRLRLPSIRFTGALLGLLLLAVQVTEGLGLHHCPWHDGIPPVAQHSPVHHQHSSDNPEHSHKDGCHCLGACCFALQAMAVAADVVLPSTAVEIKFFPAFTVTHLSSRTDHVLPFAIGPPRFT